VAAGIEATLERVKRILIVGDPNSPLTRERGTVGRKGGYDLYWYSAGKADWTGLELAGSISPPFNGSGMLGDLCSPFSLRKAIHRIQPDLIHVHYGYQKMNSLVLTRFNPLLLTIMGGDVLPEQGFQGRKAWLIKRLLESADLITSKSVFLDRALQRIGDFGDKIRRITWGVDTRTFRPGLDGSSLRRRWNIQPDELVFLCPRICQPLYNKDLHIRAFSLFLRRSGLKAKLIVGELYPDDAYQARLRALVAELGLQGQVCFAGALPHPEMPVYFNLADIMVATPRSDGMPQSLYEAMACGSFPILGNLPQYQEMVRDGLNGRLVTVGDVDALAQAMHWVAVHPDHRRNAAFYNRRRILDLGDKEVQDQLVNRIYGELIEKYSTGV
jgi:glycosyltransferase involved in cell wall biosynthesis